jgi:hypothetical protein
LNYTPVIRNTYDINGNKFNAKINYDKYYTPVEIAKYCIDKTYKIIHKNNITEIIEPSAGNGSFSTQIKNCIAYDIEPESDNIIKQDFFKLNLEYKKGRLFIGNPPYGFRNNLALKFYKTCVKFGDYISFILPASQYKNNYQMYEFDLIHSELIDSDNFIDLDKRIRLTFNIYKRPIKGIINKKKKYKFIDFELYEKIENKNPKRARVYKDNKYDFRICTWGQNCGKILSPEQHYTKEVAFYIHNPLMKDTIYNIINNIDIKKDFNMTSTPNLLLWMICEYLIKNIPELK